MRWYPAHLTSVGRRRKEARHGRTPDLLCQNCGWTSALPSVAILYTANAPTPSVPEAFAPDVTMRPEIDGFVRVSVVVIGPWCRERSAKQRPRRQATDNGGDGEAMVTPSGVCRRRARNRTNGDSRANREGDQSFFHQATSIRSFR